MRRKLSPAEIRACLRSRGSLILAGGGFISSSGTRVGTAVNGVKSGSSVKASRIGEAAASNWFIGGRPRICSIVLSRLTVL